MRFIKTTAAILIATSIGVVAMAQKLKSIQVPAAVKASFKTTYPGVKTVTWEKEKGDFEAGFKKGSNKMSAVFKTDGTQLESELGIKAAGLPVSIITYVKQNYKGSAIKEAAKITKANGEVNYEAEVNGKDLIFDGAGKFLKVSQD